MFKRGRIFILFFIVLAFLLTGSAMSEGTAYAVNVGTPFLIVTSTYGDMGRNAAFDGTNYLVGMEEGVDPADNHDTQTAQFISQSGTLVGSRIYSGFSGGGGPIIGFNGTNYLMAWPGDDNVIYGKIIDKSGTAVTAPFAISTTNGNMHPSAIICISNMCNVLWSDSNGMGTVYGRDISPTGEFLSSEQIFFSGTRATTGRVDIGAANGSNGSLVAIDTGSQILGLIPSVSGPTPTTGTSSFVIATKAPIGTCTDHNPVSIAFDGTNYLVVWNDNSNCSTVPTWDVLAQRVDASGNLVGTPFKVNSANTWRAAFPSLAFDGTNYLVTWTDGRNDANRNGVCDQGEGTCDDIYGQLISTSGVLVGSEFVINNNAGNQMGGVTGFNAGKYLVIVTSDMTRTGNGALSGGTVYGVFLNLGNSFPIATTAGQEVAISAAFDGTNYLIGIQGDAIAHNNVTAQIVSQSGTLVSSRISVGRTGGAPTVAFDGTNYLMIWADDATNPMRQYGQLIGKSGQLVGSPFPIAQSYHDGAKIIFDGTNYFVVWETRSDYGSTDTADVYGQFITPSGTLLGSAIPVSIAIHGQRTPALAFDGTNILVIWIDGRNQSACYTDGQGTHCSESDIYGQFVTKSSAGVAGGLSGSNFLLNASSLPRVGYSRIIFDGTNYFIGFVEETTLPNACPAGTCIWHIFGQIISPAGIAVGGLISISTQGIGLFSGGLGFDGTQYLIAWTDATTLDVNGQLMSKSGTPIGTTFVIDNDTSKKLWIFGEQAVSGKLLCLINTGIDLSQGVTGDVYGVFLNIFPASYTVTVDKSGTGTGTVTSNPSGISCGADCSEAYTYGTPVTLTAAPNSGSVFTGWSGSGCSGTGQCVVNMDAAKKVAATFNLQQFTLSASDLIKVVQGDIKATSLTLTSTGDFNKGVSLTYAYEGASPVNATIIITSDPVVPTANGITLPLRFAAATTTPTGTYTIRITANGGNMTQIKGIQVLVLPPMGLSTQSLPGGVKDQAYSQAITVTGGISPYTFIKTAGSLPDGITQNPDGTFSGIPSARGTFAFTILITDSAGHTFTKDYAIKIYDPYYRALMFEANSWTVGKSALEIIPSGWITVKVVDSDGQPVNVDVMTPISLSSSSDTGRFSLDGSNFIAINPKPSIQIGFNSIEFQYKDTTAGVFNLNALGVANQPSTSWQSASHAVTVTTPGLEYATLVVSAPPKTIYGQGVTVSGTLKDAESGSPLAYKTISIQFTAPSGTKPQAYAAMTNSEGGFTHSADQSVIDAAGNWMVQVSFKDNAQPVVYNDASVTAFFAVAKVDTSMNDLVASVGSITPNGEVTVTGQLTSFAAASVNLSGITIVIHFIAPDGTTIHSFTTTTYDKYGHFVFTHTFDNAAAGLWTIQASMLGTGNFNSIKSDTQNLNVVTAPGYAILIQGDSGGLFKQNYAYSIDDIYKRLLGKLLMPEDIYYLSQPGATHDAAIETNGNATLQSIENAIKAWVYDRIVTQKIGVAPLYIVLMDHGGKGGKFYLGAETLTPGELNTWLSSLEADIKTATGNDLKTVIVNGFCYSGGFIQALSKEGRVIISSSAEDEQSVQGPVTDAKTYGEYFVYYLFDYLGKGYRLRDAFREATQVTHDYRFCKSNNCGYNSLSSQGSTRQHPLLDDNSDGKGSWLGLLGQEDGKSDSLASRLVLGLGSNPVMLSVTEVMPTTTFPSGTTSVVVYAKTSDPANTKASWVEVVKPSYAAPDSGGTGQVVMNLPKAIGTYNEGTGKWESTISLDESGMYRVYYYAMDSGQNTLPPVTGTFYVNTAGNRAPSTFALTEPEENREINDALMLFKWQRAVDPDHHPVTYTLRIYEDVGGSKGPEIKRYELIPQEFFYFNGAREKRGDGTTNLFTVGASYWWEIEAIDGMGAFVISDVRKFRIMFTNLISGILTGIVYSDRDFALIASATVMATIGNSTIPVAVINGAFAITVQQNSIALAANAGGYGDTYVSDIPIRSGDVTTVNIIMSPTSAKLGDVDGVNERTIADVILALQVLTRSPIPGSITIHKDADVNSDNKIGLAEVIYILQKAAGIR
jgi:hypothetical protein